MCTYVRRSNNPKHACKYPSWKPDQPVMHALGCQLLCAHLFYTFEVNCIPLLSIGKEVNLGNGGRRGGWMYWELLHVHTHTNSIAVLGVKYVLYLYMWY